MTFIDWSDSEGMFGLLVEFVADECKECDTCAGKCPQKLPVKDLLKKARDWAAAGK